MLLQLAEALDVTLDALVGEGGTRAPEEDPWLAKMMGILRSLPPEARPVALAVLRGVAEATLPKRAERSGSGAQRRRKLRSGG